MIEIPPTWVNAVVEVSLLVPVLAFMWSPQLGPAKKTAVSAPVVAMGESFDNVWNGMQLPEHPIRVIPLIESKSVRTERIVPVPIVDAAPVDVPSVAVSLDEDKPAVRRRRHVVVRRDICGRHNMRKQMIGRYKWRCRR